MEKEIKMEMDLEVKMEDADLDLEALVASFQSESEATTTKKGKFSDSYRKRKADEIESGIRDGFYSERPKCENFNVLINEHGAEIDRLRCVKCLKVISAISGGHKTIHRNGKCILNRTRRVNRKPEPEKQKNLRTAMLEYAISSGTSLANLSKEPFKSFVQKMLAISDPIFDSESLLFPTEELFKETIEKDADIVYGKIAAMIREPINQNDACFFVDFGEEIENFLLVFLVFVDRNASPIRLKSVPFAFYPSITGRNASSLSSFLVSEGKRYSLSKEEIRNIRVVGEGFSELKDIDEDYLQYYRLCSQKSIENAVNRCLDPDEEDIAKFTKEELEMIHLVSEIVDKCCYLAITLRRKKDTYKLSKLPADHYTAPWSSVSQTCADILSMKKEIEKIKDPTVKELYAKINSHLTILKSSLQVINKFEAILKVFEESSLHEIAPTMFQLRTSLKTEEDKVGENDIMPSAVVAKAARIAVDNLIEKKIGHVHLLAVFLCPGLRSMRTMPEEFKNKTEELIVKKLGTVDAQQEESILKNFQKQVKSTLYETPTSIPTPEQELNDYQSMPLCWRDFELSPLEFWSKYSSRFPRLTKIASNVFCCLSSSTTCESSISELKLFDTHGPEIDYENVEQHMFSFLNSNNHI